MSIRLFLADDHRMFRETLRIPLEAEADIEVIGEAATGREVLEHLEVLQPDILILDINLPDINGIELAGEVDRRYPATRIVALSGYTEKIFVDEMLKSGAQAYVVKSAGAQELIFALRAVARGHCFLSPEITHRQLSDSSAATAVTAPLSKREHEVLRLLAEGHRSHEIAEQLAIATATVDVHRRNIKQKLGLSSIAELTRYAIRSGLLAP